MNAIVVGYHPWQVAIFQTVASSEKICPSAECRSTGRYSASFVIALFRCPYGLEIFHIRCMRLERETDVMGHSRMFGKNLDRGYPCVLGESRRDRHPHPLDNVVFRMSGNIKCRAPNDDIGPNHP